VSKPPAKKSALSKGRTGREYGRPTNTRQPRRLILILCEGSETERNYFIALRQAYQEPLRVAGVQVKVIPGGEDCTDPGNLLASAKDESKKHDIDTNAGDRVWCVFDMEKRSYESLKTDITTAQNRGLYFAISNPAFEYWYLLHFVRTDRPFADASELINELRKHLPHYNKNMAAFQCLGAQTSRALKNAEELHKQNGWSNCPNPSTGVDALVREIVNPTVAP
jgi:hypothetical protein